MHKYYTPQKIATGPVNYWLGFAALVIIITVFLSMGLRSITSLLTGTLALSAFILGYFVWGLVEYTFHRFVYHHPVSPAYKGHMAHHENTLALIIFEYLEL